MKDGEQLTVNSERETRVFSIENIEVREASDEEPARITGYAAVYDVETNLGDFREVVRPGAFAQAIERDDVRALFNHDANYVLGRNRAGTLALRDDEKGLGVEITPPATQWAADLMTSMRRGDVSQMSFAFSVNEHSWDTRANPPLRELKDVNLYDVSVVTYPAYPETSAQARQEARDLMTAPDGADEQALDGQSDDLQTGNQGQARRLARRKVEILKRK